MDNSSVIAKTKEGELYVWGYNNYGILGVGDTTNRTSPVKIEGIKTCIRIDREGGILEYRVADDGCCYRYERVLEE